MTVTLVINLSHASESKAQILFLLVKPVPRFQSPQWSLHVPGVLLVILGFALLLWWSDVGIPLISLPNMSRNEQSMCCSQGNVQNLRSEL